MQALFKALMLVGLTLVLSACPSLPPPPDDEPATLNWPQRQQWLEEQRHFNAKGRISIVAPQSAEQGDFVIENRGDRYRVRIIGPLGLGAVTLDGGPGELTLSSARHGNQRITNPDAKLAAILGFNVPVQAMSYWLLGIPDPGRGFNVTVDQENARAERMSQGGWQINYSSYKSFDGIELPRKIDLSNGEVQIRIVFRSWELPAK